MQRRFRILAGAEQLPVRQNAEVLIHSVRCERDAVDPTILHVSMEYTPRFQLQYIPVTLTLDSLGD